MASERNRAKKRARRRKRLFWQRMQWLFLAAFLICFAILASKLISSRARLKEERAMAVTIEPVAAEDVAGITPENPSAGAETGPLGLGRDADEVAPGPTPLAEIILPEGEPIASADGALPEMLDDAKPLYAQNNEYIGSIDFGEQALYVCQTTDNQFYVTHRFNGANDKAGCIFADYRCSIWPRSDNIVLYGHAMWDGSRFGKLMRFKKASYLKENPTVYFSTLYEAHAYVPISVFYTSVDLDNPEYFDFVQVDFEDEAEFNTYIDEITGRSMFNLACDVHYGDKLLTLSTCDDTIENGRLIVVCRQAQ